MKNYIGCKMVKAEEMSRGEYNLKRGWQIPVDENPDDAGYYLVYPDGYVSWSPKEIFESAYMQLEDNKNLPFGVSIGQEMVDDFVAKYETLTLGECTTVVRCVLKNGFTIVESSSCVDPKNYSEKIGKEICIGKIKDKIWELLGFFLQTAVNGVNMPFLKAASKNQKEKAEVNCVDFGKALESIKNGKKARRKGWNGKEQYIELAQNISYQNMDGEIINCNHENIGNKAIAFVGTSGVQMGWLASQADMLADDWIILDVPDVIAEAGESAGQYADAPTLMPAAF